MPLDAETRARLAVDASPERSSRDAAAKRKRGVDRARAAGGATDRRRAKADAFGPAATARRAIDAACQRDEFAAAWDAFEDARRSEAYALAPHSCNVLLHLCAGGVHTSEKGVYPAEDKNVGSSDKEKPPSNAAVPSRDAVFPERANDVFNYMVRCDVPRTEMTYTALARVEAAAGKPRQSFDVALRSVSERLRPKLRTFAPALHAFAIAGEVRAPHARITRCHVYNPASSPRASHHVDHSFVHVITHPAPIVVRRTKHRLTARSPSTPPSAPPRAGPSRSARPSSRSYSTRCAPKNVGTTAWRGCAGARTRCGRWGRASRRRRRRFLKVRSIHWSPYDRVRVVNADP